MTLFEALIAGNVRAAAASCSVPFVLEDRTLKSTQELEDEWAKQLRNRRTDLLSLDNVEVLTPADAEKKYGEVLGVHMIGPHVTDMIAAGVVAIKLEATLDYMTETIHAHPTLSEVMLEAYEDAAGHAIHKL